LLATLPRKRGRDKKDGADGKHVKDQRHALPHDQRQPIRHRRQQRREAEEEWRVVPAVERRGGAEDGLFAGPLPGRVEGRRGQAVQHIGAGGIDVGKIGAERPAEPVVEAVRGDNQECGANDGRGQQDKSDQPDPFAGQPAAGAQKVNETGHKEGFSRGRLRDG
jgi:hypothetical protein